MRVVKFEGKTMRDALAKVKRELGSNAIVVSTRQVRRGLVGSGVEVSAAIDEDPPVMPPVMPERAARGTQAPPPSSSSLASEDLEQLLAPLRSELRSLRSMLRGASAQSGDAAMRAELRAVRQILEAHHAGGQLALDEVAAKNQLARPSVGRIVALVGPTGVGKTTTIAKLAARASLIQGREVGVVTLDNYRVGGTEQMQMFADLIGIPVHAADNGKQLAAAIAELAHCDLIYIDTAGRSPRDTAAIRALRKSLAMIGDLEVHLAVPAASSPQVFDSILRRYREVGIARLLITKLDEADLLDELVRAPARLSTPISYVTTGQQVPEDLHEATDRLLLKLATRGLSRRAPAAAA